MADLVSCRAELDAAAAAGGDVHLDPATPIDLATPLVLDRPVRLHGGHLRVPDGTGVVIRSDDVELRGVRIDGPGLPHYYGAHRKLLKAEGSAAAPLSGVRVVGCRLSGSAADCVWLEWCDGPQVVDNLIRDFRYSGIMLISCTRGWVAGNDVRNAPLIAPVVNCYGIAVTDLDNTEAARSRDCRIVGNHVEAIDWEGIDTHGGDGLIVQGNTVNACPRGIALVAGNDTRVASPQRCVVSGNLVDGRGARHPSRSGIGLFGRPNRPADAVITGNHVQGHAEPYGLDYVDRGRTLVGGNLPPLRDWAPLPLGGDFDPNTSYPPQYRIDGDTVHLRGGVIPRPGTARQVIGRITESHAWPTALNFLGLVKGSNATAGHGMVAVYPDGTLRLLYGSGTDSFTYFLSGSYIAA